MGLRYRSDHLEITTGTYTYDQSPQDDAPGPSITFPAIAGGATQDPLTVIQNQVSGVMGWSAGLASVPLSPGAPLI